MSCLDTNPRQRSIEFSVLLTTYLAILKPLVLCHPNNAKSVNPEVLIYVFWVLHKRVEELIWVNLACNKLA